MTFGKVLSGVDALEQSMVAVRQAVALAEEGAKCWALSAWDPGLAMPAGTAALDVCTNSAEESRAALRHTTDGFPSITPILIRGRDVAALLGGVATLEADLVAVGSHGTSPPGWCSGGVGDGARRAVLGAGPRESSAGVFPGSIVHANDGSPESRDAAYVAGGLAAFR